MKMGY